MAAVTCVAPDLRELAECGAQELTGASAREILQWADDQFGAEWCVTSSMADAVVPHLASRVRPGVHVVFLDTGYHFAETLGMRDAVAATLPVTVRTVRPEHSVAEQDARYGGRLHERDPDRCCALRKVLPLRRSLDGYQAWASGLRRDESPERAGARAIEWDAQRGMIKINPIVAWTQGDVDAYVARHQVLVNPLLSDGYGSIGCAPCTRRIRPGEDPRAGRWAGTSKTECGIH